MTAEQTTYRPNWHGRTASEQLLQEYVRRLAKHRRDRRAVHLHLSRLRPYNRQPHHIRIAAAGLEPLVMRYEGALFQLDNDDLILICRGAAATEIDDLVKRLCFLFQADPLLGPGDATNAAFATTYDLAQDYDSFADLAKTPSVPEPQPADTATEPPRTAGRRAGPGDPMDPARLGAIEAAIAHADLTTLMKRQAICIVVPDLPPEPFLHEVYISIDRLRTTVLPGCDLASDPWLFQYLTRHLDRRMIALLKTRQEGTTRKSMSLNLNIETLLSPAFLEFDVAINDPSRRTIVIELQMADVFSNLNSYAFARDFLHDRGYRICLDGLSHHGLPFVDREKLGVDFLKLRWNEDLADQASDTRRDMLRHSVETIAPERIILCHCDSERALDLGRSVGIRLFQGFHLDHLLSQPRSPKPGKKPWFQKSRRAFSAGA